MRYRTTITNKEDNSVGYLDYVWVDSKLISISFTSDELNQTVKYLYNDFDEPVGFVATREDGSVDTFYYLKNAQGDITHIVSAAGKKMVSFTYDVFGKRTVTYQANGSTTPGQIELLTQMRADLLNPFAYRGYCYDYDMGMYYLQSRYYDPNVGRFINADDTNYLNVTGTVLGCNLFAYCENDPVNKVDPKGSVGSPIQWLCAAIGGIAGWFFGDYVARQYGYVPSGKGKWNATKYWAIRTGVVVGSAVVGWFSGSSLLKLAQLFLTKQPTLLLTVISRLGASALGVKKIYDIVKQALFDAGCIALSIKKCPIAKEAYYRGMYGGGKKWSSSALNQKFKNNTYFKEKLRGLLKNITTNSFSNKKLSLEFKNSRGTDLYLAIGRISVSVSGEKINGKWYVSIYGTDIYNFDSFRLNTGFSIGNVANDVGVIMQRVRMMTPYTIVVSFSTTY